MKSLTNRRVGCSMMGLVGVLAFLGTAATPPGDYEFLRIEAPGALDTIPFGVDDQGVVSGLWYPPDFTPEGYLAAEHGFLHTAAGGLRTVDAPGAVYTQFFQLNQRGRVAAVASNAPGVGSGAVYDARRDAWSHLPDPDPSSVTNSPGGVNDRGQVFGNWCDNPFFLNNHGWVYEHGRYTFFDAPGASPDGWGTLVGSANDRGDVVGFSFDAIGSHGFIRRADGRIAPIDAPFAAPGGTTASGINNQGVIVGAYFDANGFEHGFILRNGRFQSFDAPGAVNTRLTAINNRGDLTGVTYETPAASRIGFLAIRRGDQ